MADGVRVSEAHERLCRRKVGFVRRGGGMRKPRILVLEANANFLGFLRLLTGYFDITVVDMLNDPLFKDPRSVRSYGVRALYKQARWAAFRRARIGRLCNRFDLVFCEFLKREVATVSRVAQVPVVVRLHRYELDQPEYLIKPVDWSNIAKLVVVSEEYKRQAERLIPLKATVIYNGIDLQRFVFKPSSTGAICTYGHHRASKRFYDLMLALRGYELHIGGAGEDTRILQSTNERFGLRHRFYGSVTLPEWLYDKEYFVNHSMDESFGVSMVETIAVGLIPLCHDYAAAKEVVPDIYRYRYDDELRERLHFFNSLSEEKRLEHKKALRRIVEERFTLPQQAETFRELFTETVAGTQMA
jgi:glycosyltransferase involved in cell wall biosynthesis